ncbi:MAG: hypothetical protein SFU86_19180 [Pirellulaceae bacterium]|nr:hypothetical protein [Pirellulaceae bacterium]
MSTLRPMLLMLVGTMNVSTLAMGAEPTTLKTESFDRDPGWEGRNNRAVPMQLPVVKLDFGFSQTNIAGTAAGEVGAACSAAPPRPCTRQSSIPPYRSAINSPPPAPLRLPRRE